LGFETHHPLAPATDGLIAARRRALFRETPAETLKRWTLGTAWALQPSRIAGLPALGRMWLAEAVSPRDRLPDPDGALARPAGLCGLVHDLSVPTLVEAHRRGLYPFAHIAPLKWWSPPARCVLAFDDFHMSRRLRGRLRQARYRVTFDRDFDGVIKACAARREGKWPVTWITPRVMHAYAALHDAGYAHSFEVWNADDELVGGGYGVAVGGAFTMESQFTRESHTSKIGFAVLNWHLARWGFLLNDNKGRCATLVPAIDALDGEFLGVSRALSILF
jgi:leucyl/phenylalanyl-tRNA--protein transferase